MARLRGSRWQADVRGPDGSRLRPTFDTQTKAEAWEAAARLAVEQGTPIPKPGAGKAGKRDLSSLGSLFEHVKRTHWAHLRAARTLTRNGQEAVDHFGTNQSVSGITAADIDDYAATLGERGNAKATVNRKLAALSKLLKVAHDNGAVGKVPKINWRQEAKTKFRYLDDTEERALLAYWSAVGDPDQHDLCMFLIDTGARCFSEAMAMRWDDIGARAVTFWDTKTNTPRSVPITARCRAMLGRRKGTHRQFFGPFTAINKHTVRTRWDGMREVLSFHDVTPHTMRHTCCTRLVLGGADIRRVMEWMGHKSLQTTMRYLQLRPKSLEDILHILEPATTPPPQFAEAA